MSERIGYRVIRSKRRTIAIQIKDNNEIIVRAPLYASSSQILKFVTSKEDWILKHLSAKKEEEDVRVLSEKELKELTKLAKKVIPERVAYYANLIGVSYGRISIRNQKTRWGSCSSKGNLNFNVRLMLAPVEVLDSVIVHELCHRKEMNHSKKFYEEIYKVYPEYDKWNRWLKKYKLPK